MTAPAIDLEDEIAHLRDLDLSGPRARWRSVFRRKAPDHLPRHLLFRMIAYCLQAERLGDLDQETQRFLDRDLGTDCRDGWIAYGTLPRRGGRPRHYPVDVALEAAGEHHMAAHARDFAAPQRLGIAENLQPVIAAANLTPPSWRRITPWFRLRYAWR